MKLKKPSKVEGTWIFFEKGMLNFCLSRDCGRFHYLVGIFILSRIKIKWSLSKEDFKTLLKLNLFFTLNLMLGTTCTYHVASYFLLTKFCRLILFYFNCWFQIKKFSSQFFSINIFPIIFELDFSVLCTSTTSSWRIAHYLCGYELWMQTYEFSNIPYK